MSQPTRITPRTLKGFRDYLPEAANPRERLIETARRVYRSYGFSPIDTSTVGLYGKPAWVQEPRRVRYPKTVLPPADQAR